MTEVNARPPQEIGAADPRTLEKDVNDTRHDRGANNPETELRRMRSLGHGDRRRRKHCNKS